MSIYLIYSTISLGLLLLFYHLFLEKEKMHNINRGYLIFSLLFSFSIPLAPVGLLDIPINEFTFFDQSNTQESGSFIVPGGEWIDADTESGMANKEASGSEVNTYWLAAWLTYMLISGGLLIRLIRILNRIQLITDRNDKSLLSGCEIVLLNEDTVPHTFFNRIFLNKKSYLKGDIPEEVIIHEMTHVWQKHTIDILLVEFLKILFWFNPLIYLYKKAILLNHEFLADEAVISQVKSVKNYQHILLKTMLGRPAHGLTSTLNYSLTKKRFQMMTQSKSTYRSVLKVLALIPLIAAISLLPGCDFTTTEVSDELESVGDVKIQIVEDDALLVNGNRMTLDELESYLSAMTDSPDLIHLEVNPDVTFGTVTDVQTLLRKYEAFKISYSTNKDEGRYELENVTNEFLDAAKGYMEIEANQSNLVELEEKYDEVLELYEAIQSVEPTGPNTPPPPPLVPTPDKRVESSATSTFTLPPAPSAPSSPIESKNLMQILMNAQGMLLINEEPAVLADVKDMIKEIVNNRDADPDEAIVAIKTAPNTPYDKYREFLDEVTLAYDELRNQAALDQFGLPLSSLNSDESEKVKEIYPMKISIRPPDEI